MMRWLSSALWVWFLFFSHIVVHTVDVFGVEIKHVGLVVDSGYQVGGGWVTKFFVVRFPLKPDIVRPRIFSQGEEFQ